LINRDKSNVQEEGQEWGVRVEKVGKNGFDWIRGKQITKHLRPGPMEWNVCERASFPGDPRSTKKKKKKKKKKKCEGA